MHLVSFIMFAVFTTTLRIVRVHRLPQKAKHVIRNSAKRPRVGMRTEGWGDTVLSLGDSSPHLHCGSHPSSGPVGPSYSSRATATWLTQMMLSGHLTQIWEMASFGSDTYARAVGGAGTQDLSGAGYGKDLWMVQTPTDRTVLRALFSKIYQGDIHLT